MYLDEVFNINIDTVFEDLFTDSTFFRNFIGSRETFEGEYFCDSHDHLEKKYLDEVFNINIDTVFEDLFTDSTFFRNFVGSRETFDLNLQNWKKEPDENVNKVRHISYTLTLNNAIGPSTSPSTEKQIYYSISQPGRIYHIDCECSNGGSYYSDYFYVLLRYCLTRVSSTKCRVVVTGEMKDKKYMLIRGTIESYVVSGLTDYFSQLSAHLRRKAQLKMTVVVSHQKLQTHTCAPDNEAAYSYPERQNSAPQSPSKALHGEDNTQMICTIIFILILALLSIAISVFFNKL